MSSWKQTIRRRETNRDFYLCIPPRSCLDPSFALSFHLVTFFAAGYSALPDPPGPRKTYEPFDQKGFDPCAGFPNFYRDFRRARTTVCGDILSCKVLASRKRCRVRCWWLSTTRTSVWKTCGLVRGWIFRIPGVWIPLLAKPCKISFSDANCEQRSTLRDVKLK